MNYLALLFLLDDYRYLYRITQSPHSRSRYLFWTALTVVQHDRMVRQ